LHGQRKRQLWEYHKRGGKGGERKSKEEGGRKRKGGDGYRHGILVKGLAGLLSHNSRSSAEPSSKADGFRNALSTLHILKANRPVRSIPIDLRCEEHIATNYRSVACANISIFNADGK
jgi:hypothetical protein